MLTESDGERALTFALGLLITIGTFLYVIYTATGLALLPVALIKSAPAISAPSLAASTAAELEQNRERQRQLDARNEGRPGGLDARDRRELEGLLRDERTLVRRERLAAEARGEGRGLLVRAWHKLEAVLRPIKLLGGLALLALSLLVFASMLVTGIDKAKNSACGARCGYILGATHLFQPLNALLLVASRAFPADYVLLLLLVLHLFASSVAGLAAVGIRALWAVVFRVRRGRTSPQALLLATLLLALVGLAIDYAVVTMVAPRYATFGPQAYCDRAPRHPGEQPDCAADRGAIRPCAETATNEAAQLVCTPSVASTFINRMTANFPFFGVVDFWAQFAFLGAWPLRALPSMLFAPNANDCAKACSCSSSSSRCSARRSSTWRGSTPTSRTTRRRACWRARVGGSTQRGRTSRAGRGSGWRGTGRPIRGMRRRGMALTLLKKAVGYALRVR
jgi:LMBR1 domain-containing protein 1